MEQIVGSPYTADQAKALENLVAQKGEFGDPPDDVIAHALLDVCHGHGGKARGLLQKFWSDVTNDPWGLWEDRHGKVMPRKKNALESALAADLQRVEVQTALKAGEPETGEPDPVLEVVSGGWPMGFVTDFYIEHADPAKEAKLALLNPHLERLFGCATSDGVDSTSCHIDLGPTEEEGGDRDNNMADRPVTDVKWGGRECRLSLWEPGHGRAVMQEWEELQEVMRTIERDLGIYEPAFKPLSEDELRGVYSKMTDTGLVKLDMLGRAYCLCKPRGKRWISDDELEDLSAILDECDPDGKGFLQWNDFAGAMRRRIPSKKSVVPRSVTGTVVTRPSGRSQRRFCQTRRDTNTRRSSLIRCGLPP